MMGFDKSSKRIKSWDLQKEKSDEKSDEKSQMRNQKMCNDYENQERKQKQSIILFKI